VYLTINCKCCGVYPRWATLLWKCKNNLTGFKHWHDTPSGKFQTTYCDSCTKLFKTLYEITLSQWGACET
jgi:hypothetical protein